MPDGNVKTTNKCGSVFLNKSLVLKDVLYVPSFKFNLLSVGKILRNGALGCHFCDDLSVFQDQKTSKVIAMGKLRGSLYILDSKCFKQNEELHVNNFNGVSESLLFSAKNGIVDIVVWHSRLGHPSKVVSKHVVPLKDKNLDGLLCEICPMANQTRLAFEDSSSVSSDIFDILHVDIWGPYK